MDLKQSKQYPCLLAHFWYPFPASFCLHVHQFLLFMKHFATLDVLHCQQFCWITTQQREAIFILTVICLSVFSLLFSFTSFICSASCSTIFSRSLCTYRGQCHRHNLCDQTVHKGQNIQTHFHLPFPLCKTMARNPSVKQATTSPVFIIRRVQKKKIFRLALQASYNYVLLAWRLLSLAQKKFLLAR